MHVVEKWTCNDWSNRNRSLFKKELFAKVLVPCREAGLIPPVKYFTDRSKAVLLLWIVCVFVPCVSHAFASVHCCLMVTCWERADLLASVGDVYCISVTFPCGILGQVWYLIVSLPDLCILSYFKYITSPLTVTLLNWMWTVFCISVITLMSDMGS